MKIRELVAAAKASDAAAFGDIPEARAAKIAAAVLAELGKALDEQEEGKAAKRRAKAGHDAIPDR